MLSDEERELIKLLKLIDFDDWKFVSNSLDGNHYTTKIKDVRFFVYENGGILVDGYIYCCGNDEVYTYLMSTYIARQKNKRLERLKTVLKNLTDC